MRLIKTLSVILIFLLGLVIGVSYGWLINPAPAANTSLDSLRQDFKADYVLMAAEGYEQDSDLKLAVQRVSLLGGEPAVTAQEAVIYASKSNYAMDDLQRMASLTKALQAGAPIQAVTATPAGGQP